MKRIIKYLLFLFKYRSCTIKSTDLHTTSALGKGVTVARHVYIGKHTIIGDYTYLNNNTEFISGKIGSYCSIGSYCLIGPDSHPTNWISTSPNFYQNYSTNHCSGYKETKIGPLIGNDVWIGAKVIILRGVTIGDGAVIAAGSVVTKNVEPYSIVAGVPAKLLKYRFKKETVEKLVDLKIWDNSCSRDTLRKLADNKELFENFL